MKNLNSIIETPFGKVTVIHDKHMERDQIVVSYTKNIADHDIKYDYFNMRYINQLEESGITKRKTHKPFKDIKFIMANIYNNSTTEKIIKTIELNYTNKNE